MKAKDILELTIDGYGMEGEGVAHADDYTFFVPYAMVGERVKVAVDRVKGRIVFAHIIKMISPSPLRVEPGCPLFGKCGGCTLRHMSYDKQVSVKKANVLSLFKKNAGIDLADVPVFSAETDGYRNKIALPFGEENGQAVLGMYKRGTHKVLPLTACPLHGAWVEPLIAAVTFFAREKKISVYDEGTGKGLLRHLVARRLPYRDGYRYSIILVVNGAKIPAEREFAARIAKVWDGETSVYICKNTAHNNVILTPEIRTLLGEDAIYTEMCGGEWEVSPLSFLQVNFPVAERIYRDVVFAVSESDTIVDAYSGTGIMSALLATKAKKVIGIEVICPATENAGRNAARFGVGEKVTHLCGTVEDVLPQLVSEIGAYTLVVDPPRAGLDETVVETILRHPPERILYVSCAPATLTRDIARLGEGYTLKDVRLYDMFPATPHIETFVKLKRRLDN